MRRSAGLFGFCIVGPRGECANHRENPVSVAVGARHHLAQGDPLRLRSVQALGRPYHRDACAPRASFAHAEYTLAGGFWSHRRRGFFAGGAGAPIPRRRPLLPLGWHVGQDLASCPDRQGQEMNSCPTKLTGPIRLGPYSASGRRTRPRAGNCPTLSAAPRSLVPAARHTTGRITGDAA
jgi:hypothetical protein